MKTVYNFSCLCILFFCMHHQVLSQTPLAPERFVMNTDYNRFWQNDTLSYLEIAIGLSSQSVFLSVDSSGYHGRVDVNILIREKSSGAMVCTDRFNVPLHVTDTTTLSKSKLFTINRTYIVGAGSYDVSVIGYDAFSQAHCDSSSFSVDITRRPDTLAISDVELCTSILESSDHHDSFYKNSYRVVPNPSCIFGTTSSPVAFTYMELYNLDIGTTYRIKAQIVDLTGSVKKERTSLRRYTVRHAVEVTTMNVTALNSGRYTYEVIMYNTLHQEKARSRRPIYIHNPAIQSISGTMITARSAEFAGMSSEELADEFQKASYLARAEEKKAFNSLTTIEAKREYLGKFWTRIEGNEEQGASLTRAIYLQRLSLVDQRYKALLKEGWRTDQGRIYLLYGEPDDIQRFPNLTDAKPYEIWYYHQIENGVQFVFIDIAGFNDYMLVHSTKRGEIQDQNWEKLLRRTANEDNVY